MAPTPQLADALTSDRALLADVLEQVRATATRPLSEARSLPAAAYTDPAYHAWEIEHVFRRQWICLGHISEVPQRGDYIAFDLPAGLCDDCPGPAVMVRGQDGFVREVAGDPMSRALPKRGRSIVLAAQSQAGLPWRTEICDGFVFLNASGDAPPVSQQLEGLRRGFLDRWNLAEAVAVWYREWPADLRRFNWKVIAENFMEYYHHMGAHARTLEPMLPARGCWCEPVQENWCAAHLPLAPELAEAYQRRQRQFELVPFPGLTEADLGQWWVFMGYPSFLLFVAPDRVFWMRCLPTAVDRCELCHVMLVHPSALHQPDFEAQRDAAGAQLEEIHLEDVEACTGVQRGAASVGWAQGRLSHLDEPVWQIQQYLARRIEQCRALET